MLCKRLWMTKSLRHKIIPTMWCGRWKRKTLWALWCAVWGGHIMVDISRWGWNGGYKRKMNTNKLFYKRVNSVKGATRSEIWKQTCMLWAHTHITANKHLCGRWRVCRWEVSVVCMSVRFCVLYYYLCLCMWKENKGARSRFISFYMGPIYWLAMLVGLFFWPLYCIVISFYYFSRIFTTIRLWFMHNTTSTFSK